MNMKSKDNKSKNPFFLPHSVDPMNENSELNFKFMESVLKNKDYTKYESVFKKKPKNETYKHTSIKQMSKSQNEAESEKRNEEPSPSNTNQEEELKNNEASKSKQIQDMSNEEKEKNQIYSDFKYDLRGNSSESGKASVRNKNLDENKALDLENSNESDDSDFFLETDENCGSQNTSTKRDSAKKELTAQNSKKSLQEPNELVEDSKSIANKPKEAIESICKMANFNMVKSNDLNSENSQKSREDSKEVEKDQTQGDLEKNKSSEDIEDLNKKLDLVNNMKQSKSLTNLKKKEKSKKTESTKDKYLEKQSQDDEDFDGSSSEDISEEKAQPKHQNFYDIKTYQNDIFLADEIKKESVESVFDFKNNPVTCSPKSEKNPKNMSHMSFGQKRYFTELSIQTEHPKRWPEDQPRAQPTTQPTIQSDYRARNELNYQTNQPKYKSEYQSRAEQRVYNADSGYQQEYQPVTRRVDPRHSVVQEKIIKIRPRIITHKLDGTIVENRPSEVQEERYASYNTTFIEYTTAEPRVLSTRTLTPRITSRRMVYPAKVYTRPSVKQEVVHDTIYSNQPRISQSRQVPTYRIVRRSVSPTYHRKDFEESRVFKRSVSPVYITESRRNNVEFERNKAAFNENLNRIGEQSGAVHKREHEGELSTRSNMTECLEMLDSRQQSLIEISDKNNREISEMKSMLANLIQKFDGMDQRSRGLWKKDANAKGPDGSIQRFQEQSRLFDSDLRRNDRVLTKNEFNMKGNARFK